MVNTSEPLTAKRVVIKNKSKVLKGFQKKRVGLGQKARGQVQVLLTHLAQMAHPRRRGGILRHSLRSQDKL